MFYNVKYSPSFTQALIAIGGYQDNQPESFMQYFDDEEDGWIPLEKVPKLPYLESRLPHMDLLNPSVVVVKGNLYVAGGQLSHTGSPFPVVCSISRFHRYCGDTNTWVDLPSMHDPRVTFSLVHLGDYIYAIGGQDRATDPDPWVLVERFHIDKEEWEKLPPQPWGNWSPIAVVCRGKILIYGPDEYDDSPGEQSTYTIKAFFPETNTWKTVWTDHRVSGYRQSIITVINDVCYEIRFVFDNRNVPVVRELVLDLESNPPTCVLGEREDQSSIECNEVSIKGDLYVIVTFPGFVYRKDRGSWFHSSNIDGASASVVCYTFDKLRLITRDWSHKSDCDIVNNWK